MYPKLSCPEFETYANDFARLFNTSIYFSVAACIHVKLRSHLTHYLV